MINIIALHKDFFANEEFVEKIGLQHIMPGACFRCSQTIEIEEEKL